MTNLPYPYLDQSEFPAIPAALVIALQGNFDALATGQLDTGNRSLNLRFGTDDATFTSDADATKTVTHGMGSTPVALYAVSADSGLKMLAQAYSPGATTFTVKISTIDGSTTTGTSSFYWLAIG